MSQNLFQNGCDTDSYWPSRAITTLPFLFIVHCMYRDSLKSLLAHLSRRLKSAFLITICSMSVVVVVVVVFPNFSHFHLLLQNHWAISTKLGTKQLWVKETQVCSIEGLCPFPRGNNYEIAKIH